MKISYNWLRTHISTDHTPEELVDLLTQSGLEVTHTTPFRLLPDKLLIGKVLSCTPHPNATRLKKTTVDIGMKHPLSIICGATNIAEGQKVIVAPVGAKLTLPSGDVFEIKKKTLRNEPSEGMICAAEEIGLQPEEAGHIFVVEGDHAPGASAEKCLKLCPDTLLEIDITPNRGDATSHLGIAREVAALSGKNITHAPLEPLIPTDNLPISIVIKEKKACPSYHGIIIDNLTIKPSPIWLQNRLRSIGLTPMNNLVDAANFIMHDIGQPVHLYDYDTIQGKKLTVQKCPSKTPFTTIHGKSYSLTGDELMVCDAEGPLCMAGIIGGERGKITNDTRRAFIEIAYFDPITISQSVRHHHLSTDASFRFERTTNPAIGKVALKKTTLLIEKLAGGSVASQLIAHTTTQTACKIIPITYAYIDNMIGEKIRKSRIRQILQNLDIVLKEVTDEGFTAIIPTYRPYISLPIDLVEEILRIYGYNTLATKKKAFTIPLKKHLSLPEYQASNKIADFLAIKGYHEIKTNPLVTSTYTETYQKEALPHQITLLSPKNRGLDSLRQTLLFSGLEVVRHNLAHQQLVIKLFEIGRVYTHQEKKFDEKTRIALWLAGDYKQPTWREKTRPVRVHDLTAIIHQLFAHLSITPPPPKTIRHPHFERCLSFSIGKDIVAHAGEIAP